MNSQTYSYVRRIAEPSVRRLSLYLRYLEEFERRGDSTVASDELARCAATTPAQVRKDLSAFGSFGKRGVGYSIHELAGTLRRILGIGRDWKVVIVGAGRLGAALAGYRGFAERGFRVVAVFDSASRLIGSRCGEVTVSDVGSLEAECRVLRPEMGIVTVPGDAAQVVIDRLVESGISAILNFAPIGVQVPDHVRVRNVSMALELEVLAYALSRDS